MNIFSGSDPTSYLEWEIKRLETQVKELTAKIIELEKANKKLREDVATYSYNHPFSYYDDN